MNMLTTDMDTSAEEVTYRPNRAARRRMYALSHGVIKKKTHFGRVRNSYYDPEKDTLVLRHSTRGKRTRKITDHLMNELLAS